MPASALQSLLADPEALQKVLLRHVIKGSKITAGDIPAGRTELDTAGGEKITVTKDENGVSIKSAAGSAKVVVTDALATNGVVHAVDSVF